MKKFSIFCLLVSIFFFAFACSAGVDYSYTITEQASWKPLGTFTAGITTPDETHRTIAAFKATTGIVEYNIPAEWNVIILRCLSLRDEGADPATVVDVFAIRTTTDANDQWNRVCTLTFTTGTQKHTDATYYFADTVVETNFIWPPVPSTRTISPANNYIAEWFVDIRGCKKIAIAPITITRTRTAKIEITGY